MRVTLSSSVIDIRVWKADKAMMDYLEGCKKHVVLGNPKEHERAITLAYSPGLLSQEQVGLAVGVFATEENFEPQAMVLEQAGLLIIGFERELVAVDLAWARIRFKIDFETYFREMIYLEQIGILAFEEIGVSAISLKGAKRWTFTKDVITSIKLESQSLRLEFMDSQPAVVNIESGAVSNSQ